MEKKDFKTGRKDFLNYLDNLVDSKRAILVKIEDYPYCESHETNVFSWVYEINKYGNSKIIVSTGPIKNLDKYNGFSLSVESSDETISTKAINDLEKIINSKK